VLAPNPNPNPNPSPNPGYITSTCLLCTYTCGLSLLVFVHSARHSRAKLMLDVIVEGTVQAPAAAVAVGLPALIVLCVAPLLCYHTTLVCENKTTNEVQPWHLVGAVVAPSRGSRGT
jgi:hypothetical protein